MGAIGARVMDKEFLAVSPAFLTGTSEKPVICPVLGSLCTYNRANLSCQIVYACLLNYFQSGNKGGVVVVQEGRDIWLPWPKLLVPFKLVDGQQFRAHQVLVQLVPDVWQNRRRVFVNILRKYAFYLCKKLQTITIFTIMLYENVDKVSFKTSL